MNGMRLTMTNEILHLLIAAGRASAFKIGSGCIIIIKRQSKGKTHLIKALSKIVNGNHIHQVNGGTETALYMDIVNYAATTNIFYVDDKSLMGRQLFTPVLKMLKMVSDGNIKPLKLTKYNVEANTLPVKTGAWAVILVNPEQYDDSYSQIKEIGHYDRAIIIRAGHTDTEFERILETYLERGWDPKTGTPELEYHPEYFTETARKYQELTKEEQYYIKTFPVDKRDAIYKIARVMTQKGFECMKPLLENSKSNLYFNEEIEFTEVK